MDLNELESLLVMDDPETGLKLRNELLSDARLGKILVRTGIVSDATLDRALELQKVGGGLLGEVLVQLGFCTVEQVGWALGCQYAETRLGQLLLRSNTVSVPDLQAAYGLLKEGAGLELSLPEILVREGFVSEERILAVMAVQYQEAKLGQILLVAGVITEAKLAEGLERQGQTGEQLGEALRSLGYCTEEQINLALQLQTQG